MAYITEYIMMVASVQHGELTTTPPATQQTAQQSGTCARWPASANIVCDRLLNLLVLLQTHVALMGVPEEGQPLLLPFPLNTALRLPVFIAQCVFFVSVDIVT